MTKYEWFNNGYGRIGFQLGAVSVGYMMKFIRYKEYLLFIKDGYSSDTSVELVAEKLKCSRSTVYEAVKEFKDDTNVI